MDDTWDLFQDAENGDPGSWNRLFERLRPRMVLWVAARLSPKLRARIEPDDVTQEIFLAAHRSIESCRATELRTFLRWLFQIGENCIRDHADYFGAKKRQPRLPVLPSQTTPGTCMMRNEEAARVLEAVQRLPEDYRRVIQFRKLEELDTAETAERMDRSENVVRILLCRALKALRQHLDADESDPTGAPAL